MGPEGYKYTSVVRGRAAREALQGYECPQCKAFYEALGTWGVGVGRDGPQCGHAKPGQGK